MTDRLKAVMQEIGWGELVGWRAKELLATYRKIKRHYGYHAIIHQSTKISKLRRNRALVKAVGKGFADAVQVELDLTCNTKLMTFPSWYTDYSQPYRERIFKPMLFSVLDIQKAAVQETDYTDYSLTVTRFGDVKKRRMVAAYLPEMDTVYISDVWSVA